MGRRRASPVERPSTSEHLIDFSSSRRQFARSFFCCFDNSLKPAIVSLESLDIARGCNFFTTCLLGDGHCKFDEIPELRYNFAGVSRPNKM